MNGDSFNPIRSGPSARLVREGVLAGAGLTLVGGGLWWLVNASLNHRRRTPGVPGSPARWNFAGKDGVGTATSETGPAGGRVWFTIRDGAFTEIFYPRVDLPAVRGLHLIVTDAHGLYVDERSDTHHQTRWLEEGVPAFEIENTSFDRAFRIEKTVLTHPRHDAVMQATRFIPEIGGLGDYRLFVYLDPHLGDRIVDNAMWIGTNKGSTMFFANDSGYTLALACSTPWRDASVGFVGRSDGISDLQRHGSLIHHHQTAKRGNVAAIAEIDLQSSSGGFVLALGFGRSETEAAHHSRACLLEDFASIRDAYLSDWRAALSLPSQLQSLDLGGRDLTRVSMSVLRSHEDKSIDGAIVASLSIPWGEARSDEGTGSVGYHIVWPRDAVESAGALLALGSPGEALRILRYLHATQQDDGHWSQNFWVDGTTAWDSNQMGETALPILLLDLIHRDEGLEPAILDEFWPMVRSAATFIVTHGPSTLEDRWEDVPGFTPYTISVLISALLVASSHAERQGDARAAVFLRETADNWCDSIEYWTYVEDTPLARRIGVSGYYILAAPVDEHGLPMKRQGSVDLWYQPQSQSLEAAESVVSPDALAYVRFGLRAADDPRIVNTVKVIDATLRVNTPFGPSWHRSTNDGYGEKADGAPFDNKQGIGRLWPLLTGERGHYELAVGHRDEALRLLHAVENFANPTGMIPEQVWDTDDIPSRNLYFGRPSGSSMPLAWAHAEYVKLRRSLADGRIYDQHPQVYERYVVQRTGSPFVLWRVNHQRTHLPEGKDIRVELRGSATIFWQSDHEGTEHKTETHDTGLGVHIADLRTAHLPPASTVDVTIKPKDSHARSWKQLMAPRSFTMRVVDSNLRNSSRTVLERETAT